MAVNPIKVWNGTAWEYTGPVVAAPPVKYQATAPTSPATGDVWVESDYDVASVDPSKLLTGGVYTNESTRSAAIPTPTTGMVTYVGDTGTETPSATIPQLEAYTGAAWQNLGGLTLIAKTDFSSVATASFDNVFTNAYTNYKIVLIARGSTNGRATLKFRKAAADISTGYNSSFWYYDNTSGGTSGANVATYITFSDFNTATLCASLEVMNPTAVAASNVQASVLGVSYQPSYTAGYTSGGTHLADAFTGFSILPSAGTMSGEIQVYGYRKS
jgi:hypothetical protein